MIAPPGVQAVADHGALWAALGQRRLQERLEAELGEYRWDVDTQAGRLWFTSKADPSRRVESRADFVASIAPGPRSLLWGWAHPQAVHHGAADALRALGEQHGITDLITPEASLTQDGLGGAAAAALDSDVGEIAHVVAAAAVEATGSTPYYSAPLGGGSRVVFLLPDVALPPFDLAVAGAGFVSALDAAPTTSPRSAVLGLARHARLGVTSDAASRTDEVTDGRTVIRVRWDEAGRAAGFEMALRPAD